MTKYLITGNPGSGKSTVAKTLKPRGFLAQPQAVAIDVSRPLEEVVDDIIAYAQNHRR